MRLKTTFNTNKDIISNFNFGDNKHLILSGYQLLKIWLLDNQLVDTFGKKSTARHKIFQLLESS